MDKIEFLVLKNLLNNEEYLRKTIPFIKKEYFQESNQKIVFEEISSFVGEYNEVPTKEILSIEVEKRKDINEDSFKNVSQLISSLDKEPVEVANPYSGEKVTLQPDAVAVYDMIKGSEAMRLYDDVRTGLDWFRQYEPEAYMVLLD